MDIYNINDNFMKTYFVKRIGERATSGSLIRSHFPYELDNKIKPDHISEY